MDAGDETAFLKANAEHPTMYVTGFVDLEQRVLIDMIEENRAIDVSRWLSSKDESFLAGIYATHKFLGSAIFELSG